MTQQILLKIQVQFFFFRFLKNVFFFFFFFLNSSLIFLLQFSEYFSYLLPSYNRTDKETTTKKICHNMSCTEIVAVVCLICIQKIFKYLRMLIQYNMMPWYVTLRYDMMWYDMILQYVIIVCFNGRLYRMDGISFNVREFYCDFRFFFLSFWCFPFIHCE